MTLWRPNMCQNILAVAFAAMAFAIALVATESLRSLYDHQAILLFQQPFHPSVLAVTGANGFRFPIASEFNMISRGASRISARSVKILNGYDVQVAADSEIKVSTFHSRPSSKPLVDWCRRGRFHRLSGRN